MRSLGPLSALFALSIFALPACGSSDSSAPAGEGVGDAGTDASAVAYDAPGAYPVGHATFTSTDATRSRTLRFEVWYPADESARAASEAGIPLAEIEPEGATRTTLAGLVAAAPASCTRGTLRSAPDATPASGGAWPTVAFSHCHSCARWSEANVAERLASHGFAVVAPDHEGNTLFDALDGKDPGINATYLAVRAGDVRYGLDLVTNAASADVPAALRGRFDATHVGMFGHSYGGLTTGLVLATDSRVLAGVALAAPMSLFAAPKMSDVAKPLMLVVATEDNSIAEAGNGIIRKNFADAISPAWKLEVKDAGHFGFSDLDGLRAETMAGCGQGTRQTKPGESFTYLGADETRGIAAAYVTAFFSLHLRGDAAARDYLSKGAPAGVVDVATRN